MSCKQQSRLRLRKRSFRIGRKMDQSNQSSSSKSNSSRQRNSRPTLSHSSNSTNRPRHEQNCGFYNYRGCSFSTCWDAHVYDSAAGLGVAGIPKYQGKGLIARSKYAFQLNDLKNCVPASLTDEEAAELRRRSSPELQMIKIRTHHKSIRVRQSGNRLPIMSTGNGMSSWIN